MIIDNADVEKCPFCKNADKDSMLWTAGASRWKVQVRCSCGAAGPAAQSNAEAVKLWNKGAEK
jgi:hypothetical protein